VAAGATRASGCGGWINCSPDRAALHPNYRTNESGVNPMIDAQCRCCALAVSLPGPSSLVVACNCIDCQRRTGAPFGVGAFYPVDSVAISGMSKEYVRTAASGGKVRSYFCPACGSTVYWKADNLPAMIGVAVGAIAVPNYPAPVRSVFEQSKHARVEISGAEHFQQGSAPKPST
jgi:hypothetical protein